MSKEEAPAFGPGSELQQYLNLFRADSHGLTWAQVAAQRPDAPDDVRAFAAGGPALPEVWRWLRAQRLRTPSKRRAQRKPIPSYKSAPRPRGNVVEF